MALVDDFKVRYSTTAVLNYSNPDDPAATSNDDTRLNAAAADAESRFEIVTGESYDSANADHVAFAVPGVLVILQLYQNGPNERIDADLRRWERSLERLRDRGHNAAFSVKHSSNYVPSTPESGAPPFDNRRWNDLRIRPPRGNVGFGDLDND